MLAKIDIYLGLNLLKQSSLNVSYIGIFVIMQDTSKPTINIQKTDRIQFDEKFDVR